MAEVNFLVKQGLTVPKGSASTPAIIFDASAPNTGIYSPAADQVAISTNGTGRLFVDASGNVGVGASPTTKFTIFGDTHNVRVQQAAGLATAVHGYEITTAFVVDAYFKARGAAPPAKRCNPPVKADELTNAAALPPKTVFAAE